MKNLNNTGRKTRAIKRKDAIDNNGKTDWYKNKTRKNPRKKKNYVGEILKTDDLFLSSDNFKKPGRRVVVTQQYNKDQNIAVHKITKIKQKKRQQKKHVLPINKRHASLNIKSGVKKQKNLRNEQTGKLLNPKDKIFTKTNDRMSKKEIKAINSFAYRKKLESKKNGTKKGTAR